MGFFKGEEEILAVAHYPLFALIGSLDCFDGRICSSAFYLHAFLRPEDIYQQFIEGKED